jgi:hypothetical protein
MVVLCWGAGTDQGGFRSLFVVAVAARPERFTRKSPFSCFILAKVTLPCWGRLFSPSWPCRLGRSAVVAAVNLVHDCPDVLQQRHMPL